MELADYEYTVAQKCEGKWRIFKWLMLSGYLAFSAAYFFAIYKTRFFVLGALIPLFLWILVYFTYKYVKPEYRYRIAEGHIYFFKVIGKKQKEKLKIKLCDAAYIIPLETALDEIQQFKPTKTYSALPSHSSTDSYIIMFADEKGERCAFMFKATSQCLKSLHFYNKRTVLSDTEV